MSSVSEQPVRRRRGPSAAHPEVRVVTGARQRLEDRLDLAVMDPPDDPSIEAIVRAASAFPAADGWVLAGGEPTLRADLPQLVRALVGAGAPRLGIVTDGLALANPKVPAMLALLGVQRVRLRLSSARQDAHDWLHGRAGAWKRTVKAAQLVKQAGLALEVECAITRPTRPYLEETVELFARLGAIAVHLRRVTARGPAATGDVAVMPRLGLLQPELEAAVQTGVRRGLKIYLEQIPQCAAPAVKAYHLPADAVAWAVPDEGPWPYLSPRFEPPASQRGCGKCPGLPACCQAPQDYVRRFGRVEIDAEGNSLVNPGALPPTPLAGGDTPPPVRAGRHPAARLAYVRAASRLPSLSGDPLVAMQARPVPEAYRVVFLAPSRVQPPHLGDHPGPTEPESTRDVRVRLVRVAQYGARTLRIASAGSLAHPAAAELLREATRLEFERVEVAGEASALDDFSDMQLRRLRGIHRLDVALYGPDAATHDAVMGRPGAFDATMRAIDRLGGLVPSMRIGAYAVLTSEEHLEAFAEAWDFGDLPGEPWFRLASKGGDLRALARAADALDAGPARDAIAAVLPVALFPREGVLPAPEATRAWGEIPDAFAGPSGSDRYGCYSDRPSRAGGAEPGDCPGHAVGWTVSEGA